MDRLQRKGTLLLATIRTEGNRGNGETLLPQFSPVQSVAPFGGCVVRFLSDGFLIIRFTTFTLVGTARSRFNCGQQAVTVAIEPPKGVRRSQKFPLRDVAVAIAVHPSKPQWAGRVVADDGGCLIVCRHCSKWIGGR